MYARWFLAAAWLLSLATAPAAGNTWRSPDVWGSLYADGTVYAGHEGLATQRWDPVSMRYEIEFTAGPYGVDDVTVVVIGDRTCAPGSTPRVDTVGGKLLVYIIEPDGDQAQCLFRFITYFGENNSSVPAPLDNEKAFAAPIALGSVRLDGDIGSGTWGVDSVEWNDELSRYEIDITGYGFFIYDVAAITATQPGCPAGASPRKASVSGKLLVYMLMPDGERIRCGFRFVAYAANPSYIMQRDGFEGDGEEAARAIDAYGFVSHFDLEGLDNAHGIESVSWNAALGRYELTMGEYVGNSDRAMVTIVGDGGSCPAGATPRDSRQGGLLLVYIEAIDGSYIECSFTVLVKYDD